MNRLLKQAWYSFKAHYGYLNPLDYLLFMIIHPLLQLIFFSLLVKYAYGTEDITPWIIGNSFLMASGSAVFIIGTLIRSEKFQGTLQYVLLSPLNQLGIFISRALFYIVEILIKLIIGFLSGWLIFGFSIDFEMLPHLSICILSGILSGITFGLLIGPFALIIDDIHMFLNCVEQILIIFTGALFSISKLPEFIQPLQKIMPLSRSISVTRSILSGESSNYLREIYVDLNLSATYLIIGFIIYRVILHLSRREATINVY